MTPTPDLHISKKHAHGQWTLRTRAPGEGWIERKRGSNVVTLYGLNAFSSSLANLYTPPPYLAINSKKTTLSAGYSIGATSIVAVARADLTGDVQLIIGFTGINQETVTFSAVSGTGPYTYTLSTPLTKAHLTGELVIRQVQNSDTVIAIQTQVSYDSVNAPNNWPTNAGSYSSGTGQYTVQFYFQAAQCASYISTAGLVDSQIMLTGGVAQGNLHNHFTVGYDNSAGTSDLEIDSVISFTDG